MIGLQSIYRNSNRNLKFSNKTLSVKPFFSLNSYGKRAFSVAAPELWNNLPEEIKSANPIDDFKRKLKHSFLFELVNRDVYESINNLSLVYIYLLCS